jgi:hypothetical protein
MVPALGLKSFEEGQGLVLLGILRVVFVQQETVFLKFLTT